MIVDFHTHIFPPEMVAERTALAERDATFAEMYGDKAARMATAEDLLASMDGAGVDVSVVLGFPWSDMEDCRRHNDYLLEQADASDGRLVAFCCVSPAAGEKSIVAEVVRVAPKGALGLGELRSAEGFSSEPVIAALKSAGMIALFHASEPVGHTYPGKAGVGLGEMSDIASALGGPSVAAHWGGGLPFFTLMPEVRAALASTYFDTAASRFLFTPDVYRRVLDLVGAEKVLFGSDFPLVPQKAALEEARAAGLTEGELALVLGGNAAVLLGPT